MINITFQDAALQFPDLWINFITRPVWKWVCKRRTSSRHPRDGAPGEHPRSTMGSTCVFLALEVHQVLGNPLEVEGLCALSRVRPVSLLITQMGVVWPSAMRSLRVWITCGVTVVGLPVGFLILVSCQPPLISDIHCKVDCYLTQGMATMICGELADDLSQTDPCLTQNQIIHALDLLVMFHGPQVTHRNHQLNQERHTTNTNGQASNSALCFKRELRDLFLCTKSVGLLLGSVRSGDVRGDLQKKLSGGSFSVQNLSLFSNFLHRQRLKSSQVSQHHFDYKPTAVTL